jgi:uncharacterized protein YutE (UPF0331/DUF86 family)
MEFAEFLLHYEQFDREFCPNADLDDVECKCLEEMEELAEVIAYEKPLEMRIEECLDVMNMTIKLLTRYGVKDPLGAGVLKLELTAEKYRERDGNGKTTNGTGL